MLPNTSELPQMLSITLGDLRVNFLSSHASVSHNACESPLHIHATYEFQYVSAGTLQELINEEHALKISSGMALLIPPNILHRNTVADCTRHVFTITLQQIHTKETSEEYSEFQYYCGLLGRADQPTIVNSPEVSYCMNRTISLSNTPDNIHKQQSYLALMFIKMAEYVQNTVKNELPRYIPSSSLFDQRYFVIEHYVNTKYTQKTSVSDIAELLHVSKRQADRIVLQIFGKTYATLVLERRMSIALTMLQKTDISCNEIAEKTGYGSYTGFFLAFRHYYGQSPEEMRQKQDCNSL